ncbi:MAG TPA: hypothetical protein VFO69_11160 [Allosphingosinicella sp.]|nr:hypothetical protein [Allosphingosinicella sp.]
MAAKAILNRMLVAAAIATAIPLAGCTTATPYQPDLRGQRVSGGYSEERLGEGRYQVTFSGNSLTSRDRVEGYLLYRAAELTLRDGYDWFLIVDRSTERDVRTYVQPDPLYDPWYGAGYGYWRPYWRYRYDGSWRMWYPYWGDPFWGDRLDVRRIERFEAHAEIVMRRGPIPANEERAFDARRVVADLDPTIERPRRRD